MGIDPGLQQLVDHASMMYSQVHDEVWSIWVGHMVFTWHWWLDLLLAVVPWIIWIIVRDRKNTHSLLYAGLFTMLVATTLDMAGVSQAFWNYNTWLLPFIPEYLPWDLTVFPVISMLFYQFLPKMNVWLKGLAFSVIGSFVVEPLFAWLGMYELTNWKLYYSTPIYFAIYMAGYFLYTRIRRECTRSEAKDASVF